MIKNIIFSQTITATAAIDARQLVGFDGAPAEADDPVLGVAAFDAAVGDDLTVDVIGMTDLAAGAAIAAGALVASDAAGLPVQTANPDVAFGRALRAAANPGDVVTILLK